VITHGAGIGGLGAEDCAAAIGEGTLMGLYRFMRHQQPPEEDFEVQSLTLVEHDAAKVATLERGIERGRILADAANFCRDLANEPSNYLTPTEMADRAKGLAADTGLECEIYGPDWMREKGMGGVLGVAAGSSQEPRFIVLRYNGGGDVKPLALVGKGITFDTGGISIKPAAGMEEMKGDMSGGASVIAAMGAIARLRPAANVIGIVPATENMPGGNATRPGDIVTSMSGQTIEILNTDAEGRLVLCDALTYSERFDPAAVIDIATLTGACVIALGHVASGLFSNDDKLAAEVLEAGQAAADRAWHMPLWDDYQEQLKSNFADMANIGGRPAGSVTAACFLARYARKFKWAHLDIAGTAWKSGREKGSTGRPVPLLTQFLMKRAGW
jgi:leucyl aminopeptidase